MTLKILGSLQEPQVLYRGCTALPSYTDNHNGTITIGTVHIAVYDNANYAGVPQVYLVAGGTFEFTNNTTSCLGVFYNAGHPELQIVDILIFEDSRYSPVFTVYRDGNDLHITNWDTIGLGQAEKIFYAAARTKRYSLEYGLAVSEYGTRNIAVTAGKVYVAMSVACTLGAINTATDNMQFWYHVAGVWTKSVVTAYNNTQHDNGTALVSTAAGKYVVNWVYRGVEDGLDLYIVIGNVEYTQAQALAAQPPAAPPIIQNHAMLIGKIIVKQGDNIAYAINSTFDITYVNSSPTSHAGLTDLSFAAAGHTGFVPLTGITMTGSLVAQTNTTYTTAQMRNIIESTEDPSGGNNGDIWIKYTA